MHITTRHTRQECLSYLVKFLAEGGDGDAIGVIAGGIAETLDGFVKGFAAELECLMVHRYEKLSAGIISHVPGLFGRAVEVNPGIVSANGHHGDIDRPRCAQAAK